MGKVNTEGKRWVIFLQNVLTAFVVEGQRDKRCWKCFLEFRGPSAVFYRYCLSRLCEGEASLLLVCCHLSNLIKAAPGFFFAQISFDTQPQ